MTVGTVDGPDLPDAEEDTLDGRSSAEEQRVFVVLFLGQIARCVQVPSLRRKAVEHVDDQPPSRDSFGAKALPYPRCQPFTDAEGEDMISYRGFLEASTQNSLDRTAPHVGFPLAMLSE